MTENELLEYICARLCAKSGTAVFTQDEIQGWPADFVNLLTDNQWLCPANHRQKVECIGCEENCHMPVHLYPEETGKPAYAFISCDKPQDMGRITVNLQRLQQWQFTLTALAEWLAKALKLNLNNVKSVSSKEYQIGILQKGEKKSLLTLLIDNTLKLSIAGHSVELLDVLTLKKGKLSINRAKLLILVDNPAAKTETSAQRVERIVSRVKQEKEKGTNNFLQIIAEEEEISVSRVKQLLLKGKKAKMQNKETNFLI